MRKVMAMAAALVLLGGGLAQAFTIKTATVKADEVRMNNDASFAEAFNVREIVNAYPYIGISGIKSVPTNEILKTKCANEVRKNLKTPSMAKFVEVRQPTYSLKGFVYVVTGVFDSQNSYGAMVRGDFYCTMAFEGTAKGGTLYTLADIVTRK